MPRGPYAQWTDEQKARHRQQQNDRRAANGRHASPEAREHELARMRARAKERRAERRAAGLPEHGGKSTPAARKRHQFTSSLRRYGLTRETLRQLFENQEGLCAICSAPICICPQSRCKTRAHIDHDHGTSKVRGLLCGMCNPGLGWMKDSATVLRNAAGYLETAP